MFDHQVNHVLKINLNLYIKTFFIKFERESCTPCMLTCLRFTKVQIFDFLVYSSSYRKRDRKVGLKECPIFLIDKCSSYLFFWTS